MKKILVFILLFTCISFTQTKISSLDTVTTLSALDRFLITKNLDQTSKAVTWYRLVQQITGANNIFSGTNTFSATTTFNANVNINSVGGGLYVGGQQRIDNNGHLPNSSYIGNSGIWASGGYEGSQTILYIGGARRLILNGNSATFGDVARIGTDSIYAGYLNLSNSATFAGTNGITFTTSLKSTFTGANSFLGQLFVGENSVPASPYTLEVNGQFHSKGTSVFDSTISWLGGNSTNANTAYSERLEWDGGTTNLVAATGRTSLGLKSMWNVDSTTYHGSASINTLGTISSGVWQGTAIADAYISSSANWNDAFNKEVITWNAPLSYSAKVASLNYNSTNFSVVGGNLTSNQIAASVAANGFQISAVNLGGTFGLVTPQDLRTTATNVVFAGETINGLLKVVDNRIRIYNSTGGIDSKISDFVSGANYIKGTFVNDVDTNENVWIQATRSGFAVSRIDFYSDVFTTGSMTVTGTGLFNLGNSTTGYQVAGVTLSDASRNLTTGTINSGAITASLSGGYVMDLFDTSINGAARLRFNAKNIIPTNIRGEIDWRNDLGAGSSSGFYFQNTDAGVVPLVFSVISNAGVTNVGIGTTNPLGYGLYNVGTLFNNGDATFAGNVQSSNFNGVDPYVGYFIHSGGSIFDKITANELHVKSFIADLEQALAGGQVISKSVAKLYADVTTPATLSTSFTFTVESFDGFPNVNVFAQNDIVRLRSAFNRTNNSLIVTDSWAQITSLNPTFADNGRNQTWTATLVYGAVSASVKTGSIVNDYGQAGNGIVETVAINPAGNSPYSQIATWTTNPYTDMTVQDRRGDLAGITTTNWGALTGFGGYSQKFYAEGNVYIAGNIWALTGGIGGSYSNPAVSISNPGIKVNNNTLNNVTVSGTYIGNWQSTTGFYGTILNQSGLYGYQNNSLVMKVDNAGALLAGTYFTSTDIWGGNASQSLATMILGDLTTTPKIALGTSADSLSLTAGTGFYADGSGNFKAGSTSNYLKFDGSNISLVAANASITGTSGWLGASNIFSWSGSAVTAAGWNIITDQIYKSSGNANLNIYSTAPTYSLPSIFMNYSLTGHYFRTSMGQIYDGNTGWTNRFGFALFQGGSRLFEFSTDGTTDITQIAGWNFDNTQFSSTNLSGGGDSSYTTAGIAINSAGWISAKNFYLSSAGNVSVTGTINATGGNFTNYVTAGTSRFGAGVQTGKNGLWLNASNYLYDDGSFQLGGSTGITYAGSGNVTVGSNTTFTGNITSTATITGGTYATSGPNNTISISGATQTFNVTTTNWDNPNLRFTGTILGTNVEARINISSAGGIIFRNWGTAIYPATETPTGKAIFAFRNSQDGEVLTIHDNAVLTIGGVNLYYDSPNNSLKTDNVFDAYTLKTNGTQRIDASGNLTNIGTISSGAITTTGDLTGSSTMRGYDSFTTTALSDTVTISGAATGDYYVVSPAFTAGFPPTGDVLSVEALAGKLIVHRNTAGLSGLGYYWVRIK